MKLTSTLLLTALIAAATLSAAEPKKATSAEAPKATKKAEPKTNQDTYPLYGKVAAVTSRTLTIVRSDAADAEQSKFSLNASVEYVDGDKPSNFEAVKVGSWVGGSVKKNPGDGNDTILKLNVGVKQRAAAKAGKSAKKKTEPKKGEPKADTKKKTD